MLSGAHCNDKNSFVQKDFFQDVVVTAGPPGPGVSSPWQQQMHLGTFLLVRQHPPGMKIFAPFFNNPQSAGIKICDFLVLRRVSVLQ